ncbi:MAG TPA: RdgB/HAM1 family non-canonical purine NTP pyrophosphatase [Candidatus Limnocylindrales bacterium]|nr:RdgB/HAM1 family non-canonical purine NTP pyrophosphatase [Candidatus Limnocylindrales bacterium]
MTSPLRHVVLATTNKGKLRDFRFLFDGSGVELRLPEELGVRLDVEETGTTFEENALLKARTFARELPGHAVLADDSGLEVHALGGRPGVYSARYAGEPCDDHANNLKVIAEVQGLADRRAAFVAVLALVLPSGEEIVVSGRCEGRIIDEERGANGFGYDAIFFRDDLDCTFGEAAPAEKNARSHRGAAVRAMMEELRRLGLLPGGAR